MGAGPPVVRAVPSALWAPPSVVAPPPGSVCRLPQPARDHEETNERQGGQARLIHGHTTVSRSKPPPVRAGARVRRNSNTAASQKVGKVAVGEEGNTARIQRTDRRFNRQNAKVAKRRGGAPPRRQGRQGVRVRIGSSKSGDPIPEPSNSVRWRFGGLAVQTSGLGVLGVLAVKSSDVAAPRLVLTFRSVPIQVRWPPFASKAGSRCCPPPRRR